MENYPKYVVNLPEVISFDEFKADTRAGKYVFVLNDPIHKKVLDILPIDVLNEILTISRDLKEGYYLKKNS